MTFVALKRQPNMSPIYAILLARYMCITALHYIQQLSGQSTPSTITQSKPLYQNMVIVSTTVTHRPCRATQSAPYPFTHFDHHTPQLTRSDKAHSVWVYSTWINDSNDNDDTMRVAMSKSAGSIWCVCSVYHYRKHAVHELRV